MGKQFLDLVTVRRKRNWKWIIDDACLEKKKKRKLKGSYVCSFGQPAQVYKLWWWPDSLRFRCIVCPGECVVHVSVLVCLCVLCLCSYVYICVCPCVSANVTSGFSIWYTSSSALVFAHCPPLYACACISTGGDLQHFYSKPLSFCWI